MIKILMGGSPCTFWSIAQKNHRETVAEGLGWELFKNYLIAKEKFKPDFFLYENNKSAAQPIKDQISRELGVDLMYINSALVSAQNRQRFYAFNWEVPQPEDRGILLRDILESGEPYRDKSCALVANRGEVSVEHDLAESRHTLVAEPVCVAQRGRYSGTDCEQHLEARDDGKTNTITSVTKDNLIAEPVRIGTMPNASGETRDAQATRIYSIDAKSVNLVANGGGQGAKTGLYAIPCAVFNNPHGWNHGSITYEKFPTLATGFAASRQWDMVIEPATTGYNNADSSFSFINKIYTVKDGFITIKEKTYPIKLPDGDYIIRKLTPIECERLQTLPDGYTKAVSATQRYKALGNGWTAEVIIHILNGALKNVPRDEEIVVLSMYDGIATGRYCLDKMGFTNVKYYAYEIDKYAKQIAMSNYPDIIQMGDAFDLRKDDWNLESCSNQ